jgi:hypothetical protein
MNKLTISRFNGIEVFQISTIIAQFKEVENKKYLKLSVKTDAALQVVHDTVNLRALPNAEIFIEVDSFDKNLLEHAQFQIAKGYDPANRDFIAASFYYTEHQELNDNVVEIRHVSGDKYRLTWSAETQDVNFYDGSKPKSKVLVQSEFTFVTE